MRTTRKAIIAVVLVFLAALSFALLFASQNSTRQVSPITTPIPSGQPTATPSPTPGEQTFQGTILSISTKPIAFKNSLVATLEQNNGGVPMQLYVTETTEILNAQGQKINRSALRAGMTVHVTATPSEGGFEATRIQITAAQSPSPTTSDSSPSATPRQ